MGLSFLNIMLLSGMAVIAIPVLLHLLMRRKPVPHQFPAIRFLQARSQIKKRRLKLQHLLLLLVRVLALCILVVVYFALKKLGCKSKKMVELQSKLKSMLFYNSFIRYLIKSNLV